MLDNGPNSWDAWNFYAAELDLVERIKSVAQAPGSEWARIVGTRDDISAVKEDQQVVPGVYVISQPFRVSEANEFRATLLHPFYVVLALDTPVRPGRDVAQLNARAGLYLPQLLKALHGYTPAGIESPLIPATPPASWKSPSNKFAYYPLAFTSESTYSIRRGPAGLDGR